MNLAKILLDVSLRIPERIAIEDASGYLTFGDLTARAAKLAGGIKQEFGLEAGDRVVIYMENCGSFLEVLFSCWVAGLCVVPVNAKLHAREVAHILKDSGARLCFASPGNFADLLPIVSVFADLRAVLSTADETYIRLRDWGGAVSVCEVEPTDPAWIFYTSGTTGKPKGATLTFRNLLFMSHCYYADIDRPSENDTKLHAAPLSHASGLYLLPHIFKGGRQVILPGFDPEAVFAAIERYPNVTLFAAPTMVSRLLDSPAAVTSDLTNLKILYYGGGPMYVSELKRALELFGDRLYHLYGQGESPMTITGCRQRPPKPGDESLSEARLTSCGVPRTGIDVKVVDADGNPLRPGEVGEVITRSDCVMAGYWNNPEATRQAVHDGWLWTGDVGSMDEGGFLSLKDRSKDLIISGGSNIYPREIEEVLLTHPDIAECSVVGKPHPEWGEEVWAFVVLRDGARLDACELDQLMLCNIARFKRPRSYQVVESLPKNNYGKVLKTELRKLLTNA